VLYTIEVRVELKEGVVDAEGETVKKSLNLMGYSVDGVDTVKVYVLRINAETEDEAVKEMDEACRRLLANPVIQNYKVTVK